jgi:moderate conductance mechanosensitive channel
MFNISSYLNIQEIISVSLDVIWILSVFIAGRFFLKSLVKIFINLVDDGNLQQSRREQHARTIGSIVQSTGNFCLYLILLLMILDSFKIDIRPILAGVGIVGLAIGLGAKKLIADCIAGLFILIEQQYDIGDDININGLQGKVIKITLRSTILMNSEQKICYIANGLIKNVINASRKPDKME